MIMINILQLNFTARLASFASKSDIANFVKKTDLNKNELNEL